MPHIEAWRSVIRILALAAALFGLTLIANECLEQVVGCRIHACAAIHVMPIGVGLALLVWGCLVLQRGDVSVSLTQFTAAGDRVASWFGRRAYDRKSGAIAAHDQPAPDPVVTDEHPTTPPAADCPTVRDE